MKPLTETKQMKANPVFFSVSLRNDGIIHVKITGQDDIDVEKAKEIITGIGEAAHQKKRPVLISSESFSAPTPEARVFLAKKESSPYSSASAYMARTLPEKIMVNAFLKFNKPARPTKMFTSEAKAIEWLKTFL
jgi:hypothetical protein